jgi:hypothetical protein
MKKSKPVSISLFVFLFAFTTNAQTQPVVISEQLNKCLHKVIQKPLMTLAEEELVYLSKNELSLFINFIFTRQYTELRDTTLKTYFNQSDKTLSVKLKNDSSFIKATAYNLELLNAFQAADSILPKLTPAFEYNLHGIWQIGTSTIGSGLLTHYRFIQNDRSFLFEKKLINQMERLKNYSGFYTIDSGQIELEVRTKTVLKGGILKHKKMPDGKTRTWFINREEATINLDKDYEYHTLIVSPIYTIKFDGIEKQFIRINDTIYWKAFVIED